MLNQPLIHAEKSRDIAGDIARYWSHVNAPISIIACAFATAGSRQIANAVLINRSLIFLILLMLHQGSRVSDIRCKRRDARSSAEYRTRCTTTSSCNRTIRINAGLSWSHSAADDREIRCQQSQRRQTVIGGCWLGLCAVVTSTIRSSVASPGCISAMYFSGYCAHNASNTRRATKRRLSVLASCVICLLPIPGLH